MLTSTIITLTSNHICFTQTSSLVVSIMEIPPHSIIDEASVSALSIVLPETSAQGSVSMHTKNGEGNRDSDSDLFFNWTLSANSIQLLLYTG